MRYIQYFALALCTLLLANCGKQESKTMAETELFDNSPAVDLTDILDAYKWYEKAEGEDKDIKLIEKISPDLPEHAFYLFEDTSFVVRLPEYADSKHPVLAFAEDFYNSSCLGWNVWSNMEIWYRSQTADMLRTDDEVKTSTANISVDFIHDKELRKAAQLFKDSILLFMKKSPDKWSDEEQAMDPLVSFGEKIVKNAYKYYENEDSFAFALDSIMEIAECKAQDKFLRYLDADEDEQLKTILHDLASCKTFDEQCALWRNWANCEKSAGEDEWLVAVGDRLMQSGYYSPLLQRVWLTWRALCQSTHFGMSRDSAIPNHYYNEFRKKCYIACLKRIERHPDDVYAIHNAYSTGGRINLLRFGESMMGNDALMETYRVMPNRFPSVFSDENYEDEEDE